jgi:hypothetical protein
MIWTLSHDQYSPDKGWWQMANSSPTVAIVFGDVCVHDLAALPATSSGVRGVFVQQSAATANLVTVAGVCDEPEGVPAADYTKLFLVQRLGHHRAVKFTGTAAQTRIQTGAVVGAAKATAPTAFADVAGSFGLCVTSSGTPATIEAILDCHL